MLPTDVKAISVDDHVIEPPHLWQQRLPQQYREIGPRVVELEDGTQAWTFEDQVVRTVRGNTSSGFCSLPVAATRVPAGTVTATSKSPYSR